MSAIFEKDFILFRQELNTLTEKFINGCLTPYTMTHSSPNRDELRTLIEVFRQEEPTLASLNFFSHFITHIGLTLLHNKYPLEDYSSSQIMNIARAFSGQSLFEYITENHKEKDPIWSPRL